MRSSRFSHNSNHFWTTNILSLQAVNAIVLSEIHFNSPYSPTTFLCLNFHEKKKNLPTSRYSLINSYENISQIMLSWNRIISYFYLYASTLFSTRDIQIKYPKSSIQIVVQCLVVCEIVQKCRDIYIGTSFRIVALLTIIFP